MPVVKTQSMHELINFRSIFTTKNILLVTGRKSYEICGARDFFSDLLKHENVTHHYNFSTNPKFKEALKGAKLAREKKIDVIMAIGGGSVIDMSKLIKAFINESGNEHLIAKGQVKLRDPLIPLIVIPTTAGSGSEATHFAVVYIKNEKYSVASPYLMPNYVFLEPSLLRSNLKYQKACNGLDALAQAIESNWAVNATSESQKDALKAIELCWNNLPSFVNDEFDLETAKNMFDAAHLAGRAINISKTTSAHAWSYGFTSRFGTPHGHAVWLTLPKIFELHVKLAKLYKQEQLAQNLERVCSLLGIKNGEYVNHHLTKFCNSIGIDLDLQSIPNCNKEILKNLSKAVNTERMKNNPIIFSQKHVNYIFNI